MNDERKGVCNKDRETKLELNFCEFPISSLTMQRNFKPLVFSDTITDTTGNKFCRKWTVDGSLIVGTPIAEDKKVLQTVIHLMEREKCFSLNFNQLFYKQYSLCKALGWPIDGPHYEKLKESLVRLTCCKIHAQYSFWDHKQHKLLVDEIFGIIDELKIYGKKTGKSEIDCYLWDEPQGKISLSKRFFESLQANYTNTILLDYYLSLDDPTTQRLYEVLIKKLHKTGEYWFDVKTLCYEYLGMSRIYKDAGRLKQNLNKANENLKRRGFLKAYSYPKKYKGKRICYVKTAPETDELKIRATKLAGLVRKNFFGDTPPIPSVREIENVERLMREVGYKKAEAVLHICQSEAGTCGLNPSWIGGLLAAYKLKALKILENKEKLEQLREQQDVTREQEKNKQEQVEQEQVVLEKYFDSLPLLEQQEMEQKANQEADEEMQKLGLNPSKMSRKIKLFEKIKEHKQEVKTNQRIKWSKVSR